MAKYIFSNVYMYIYSNGYNVKLSSKPTRDHSCYSLKVICSSLLVKSAVTLLRPIIDYL